MTITTEPLLQVGVLSDAAVVRFSLQGEFKTPEGESFAAGSYTAEAHGGRIRVAGEASCEVEELRLTPVDFAAAQFVVEDVIIGVNFHWQRRETQSFQGALRLRRDGDKLTVINELPLEAYLVSVISSEMSASCPPELLRAHAIVSRSWLLAQLVSAKKIAASVGVGGAAARGAESDASEVIRWYDRENHSDFDVCADDHCQRYQGISKAFSPAAFAAIEATRGRTLTYDGEICDARYSKSCGGMSEVYGAAWEEKEVAYLSAVYDWQGAPDGWALPLTDETNAAAWIEGEPAAYCKTPTGELLSRILPGFDQETLDFYRWRVRYTQEELSELLGARTGIDFGYVLSLEAVERGESGRIVRLKITGTQQTVTIGKELEIRRALSPSHLYSSAFVVQTETVFGAPLPQAFTLIGAGWGHGVGLCQIGAAVMAERGFTHEAILAHYFRGAKVETLY